ncbi:restriction endonuclease subunit S [Rhodothermus marinus]|uniref:restriction endonuclease subunit S n=1 Tax=Rhodothermus marinus TaxID=29549 RepID=UPI0012BA52AD|nr:restriction endonuclease subunit S [Rhodothermus marinus]BBM69721.1 restriction endonuclease [Rhodothermus marinus]BBM72706.1 restriction endonuclease [Rhodothermus marinus]
MGSEVAFRDVAQLVRDVVQPEEAGKMPYIGLEHIEQGTLRLAGWGYASDVSSAKFRFRKGDILFGKLRPYFRKVIRAPFDGICSTDIWVVRAKEGFDQNYLFYWMAAHDFIDFASKGSEGTRMPRAKWEHVERFKRPYLPLPEQRAIAHILGTLDDKIELNRRMNETLEAMAQALFKSWFVDFDPVVVNALRAGNPIPEKFAKRAAHYRDNPDALGLPEDILRLFPARFVESELGPIPEGWEIKQVREFAALKGGQQLSKKYIKDHGPVPVFGGAGIMGYTTISNATGFVITVGRVGAYCGQFFRHIGEAWINNNASLVRVHERKLGEWLYLALRNANIDVIKKGAAQPFVANSDIECLPILWPGSNLASKLSEFVSKMRALQDHYVVESRTLAALRDTLLPKLISGELRVKDVEKILEDAV